MAEGPSKVISGTVRESMDRANQYVRDGLISRGVSEYKKILESNPDLAEIHEKLAKLYLSSGKINESIAEYQWLGNHYWSHSSVDLSIIQWKEILSLDSDQLEIREKLADAYLKQGSIRNAVTERMILANKYLQGGNKEKTISVFRDILSTDPHNVDVRKRVISLGETIFDPKTLCQDYLLLCESYLQRHAVEKAIATYQHYNELLANDNPNREQFILLFKRFHVEPPCDTTVVTETIEKKKSPFTISEIKPKEKAPAETIPVDKAPTEKNLLDKAEEHIKEKSYSDALEMFKKAVALYPASPSIHNKFSDFLKQYSQPGLVREEYLRFACEIQNSSREDRDYIRSEQPLKSALAADPDHLATYQNLIDFYNRTRNREKLQEFSIAYAKVALRQKKYDVTEQTCQKILGLDPGNVPSREILVELYKAKNDTARAVEELSRLADQFLLKQSFDNAISAYKRALELDPKNVQIHKNLIVTYLQGGNTPSAVNQCLNLGKIHQSEKAYPESIMMFRRALELDPENVEAHSYLAEQAISTGAKEDAAREYQIMARLALQSGRSEQAIDFLAKSITLFPQNISAYEEISEIYLSQNQISQANQYLFQLAEIKTSGFPVKESIPIWMKILSSEPGNTLAREKLATVYESTQALSQAVKEYEILAEEYQKQKRPDLAISSLRKTLQLESDNPKFRENLVSLLLSTGHSQDVIEHLLILSRYYLNVGAIDKAISHARRILDIEPHHSETHYLLASIYSQKGDSIAAVRYLTQLAQFVTSNQQWDEGRKAYLEAVRIDPNNLRLREQLIQLEVSTNNLIQAAEHYDSLGQLYLKQQSTSQACTAFEESLKLNPSNLSIRQQLTDLYVQQDAPNAFDSLMQLGDSYWETGQMDSAMANFKRGLKLRPKDEKLLRSVANLHLQLDQQKEAIALLYQLATLTLDKDPKETVLLAQEILRVDSGNIDGRRLLADAYRKLNAKWDSIREYLVLVDYLLKNDQPNDVIQIYKTILEIDPYHLDVLQKLSELYEIAQQRDPLVSTLKQFGLILTEKQIFDQAISVYQKIIRLTPEDIFARKELIQLYLNTHQTELWLEQKIQLAESYLQSHNYEDAVVELESAKTIQPDSAKIYWNLIQAYQNTNNIQELIKTYLALSGIFEKNKSWEEAENIYQKILEIDPKETRALSKLGELYLRRGDKEGATQQFRYLAEIYRESNQLNSAIEYLERAQQLNPADTEVYQSLAELYIQMGNKQKAVQTLLTVADLFLKEGIAANAADAYQGILFIDPEHIEARNKFAEICGQGNQPDLAAEQYYLLAQSYLKLNSTVETISALKKALQYKPQDTKMYQEIADLQLKCGSITDALVTYHELARLYLSGGELSQAEDIYRKACTVDPYHYQSRESLIELLLNQKKVSEAIDQIFQLSDIYQQKGQIENALTGYRKIIDLDPQNMNTRRTVAEGYIRWNRLNDAVVQLLEISSIYEKQSASDSAFEIYQRILEIEPSHIETVKKIVDIYLAKNNQLSAITLLLNQAEILSKKQDSGSAIELYKYAVELSPTDPKPRRALIECLKMASRNVEASSQYAELIHFFEKTDQMENAYQACREAISIDSGNTELREKLANYAIQLDQSAQAAEQYLQLTNLYQSQNKTEEMIRSFERYLDTNPRDNEIRERFMKLLEKMNRGELLAQQHISQAKLLIDDGYADRAIKYLKKPFKQFPDNIGIQLVLADAYEKTGSRRYAISAYQELAEKLLSDKKYNQAIHPLERLVGLDPNNLNLLKNLYKAATESKDIKRSGIVCQRLVNHYLKENDPRSAISCLETARTLDPGQIPIREQLIELYNRVGNKEAAVNEQLSIADMHLAADHVGESIKVLISLVQTQPTNPDIHSKLLKLYLQSGQTQEAYNHYLDLAIIYEQNKQINEAVNSLKEAIQLEPENPKAHLQLVTIYRTTGQHQEAVSEYRKLGELYQKSGQMEETIRSYQQALELEPYAYDLHLSLISIFEQLARTTEVLGQYQLLAETYTNQNEFSKAVDVYKKALLVDPKNVSIRLKLIECYLAENQLDLATKEYHILAEYYLQAEDFESAIVTYIRLIELNEKDKQLRRDLIQLYRRIGKMHEYATECLNLANQLLEEKETQEAIKIYQDVLEQEPNNLHAANGLARAYVEMGDEKSALKQFLFVNQVLSKSGIGAAVDIERVKHAGIELSTKFTFDNFVVGQHSNFAHATALAVSKNPGRSYNPLFLYSEPGMGKTHLLNAIGNYVRKNQPHLRVMYSTSETFTGELVNAIQTNTIPEFRALYRNVDVLLLEDIQFLGGRERAQEEFFHTFNTLIQSNKQVVITSDKPPKELATLEKRLTSRFQGGITVDIQKPDVETRIAILKQKSTQAKVKVEDSILDLLASSIDTNVRELEGALNKLIGYHEHSKMEITLDLAKNLLRDVIPLQK